MEGKKHSIVIMDNCSVHHVEEVTELLRQAGYGPWVHAIKCHHVWD